MTHSLKTSAQLSLVLLGIAACGATDSSDTLDLHGKSPLVRSTHVETHPSQGPQRVIEGATASVNIGESFVDASLTSSGLTPGHIYTLWFVAVNQPSRCATSPCKAPDVLKKTKLVEADVRWAAGEMAKSDGTISFAARVDVGPWSNGWFGTGLTNPTGAEIHLVVNDHGPAIPGREQAMKSTYREGCTDESLPPPFPAAAKSDGLAGPNKCALVQDAIFATN